MGREGFDTHLSDRPQMSLPLILLLRQGITSKFSNPAFPDLINPMDLFLEIGIFPFFEEYLLIMQ